MHWVAVVGSQFNVPGSCVPHSLKCIEIRSFPLKFFTPRTHTHTHIHTHTYTRTHVHTQAPTHTHTHAHTHTHIHLHTHARTHPHTHACAKVMLRWAATDSGLVETVSLLQAAHGVQIWWVTHRTLLLPVMHTFQALVCVSVLRLVAKATVVE